MTYAPTPLKETILFAIGTFVPTVALAVWAHAKGTPAALAAVAPLSMLTPMISAFLVQKLYCRQPIFRGNPFRLKIGRARWLLLAPAAFAAAILATILVSFAIAPGLKVDHAAFELAASRIHGVPGAATAGSARLMLACAMALFIGPVLNIPLFLGEELGWRGFMNPRLTQLAGRPGLLIGGAIWAFWHLPMIALGFNYSQHTWLGLIVWIPLCASMNVLLDAVKQKSGSILPCALAHGAVDQLAPLLMTVLFVSSRFNDLLDGPAGLAGLLVFAVPAILIYRGAPDTGASTKRALVAQPALA